MRNNPFNTGMKPKPRIIAKWLIYAALAACVILCLYIIAFVISSSIQVHSEYTAGQPESETIKSLYLDKWDWVALFIAFVSLIIGVATAISQWQTQKNTMKITPESQRQLLYDYARFFYMNLIVFNALRAKLNGQLDQYYPSEELITNMKVDFGNFHPAVYFNNMKHYLLISELQTKFRRFNAKLDITLTHLTNKSLIIQAKERDLDTIDFYISYLMETVWRTINQMFGESYKRKALNAKRIREIIASQLYLSSQIADIEKAEKYFSENQLILPNFSQRIIRSIFYGADPDQIEKMLYETNLHIYLEMIGKNDSGSDKIFLIPF